MRGREWLGRAEERREDDRAPASPVDDPGIDSQEKRRKMVSGWEEDRELCHPQAPEPEI